MRAFITQVNWYKFTGARALWTALQLPKYKGEASKSHAWIIGRHLANDELIYILKELRPQLAADIIANLDSNRTNIIVALRKHDLIPLEYARHYSLLGDGDVYVTIGFNCFALNENNRYTWAKRLLEWTPATHKLTPVRVRCGALELLKCLKRLGVVLPRELRMHLVRIYACADYLYQKAIFPLTHCESDVIDTQWRLLESPVRSMRYARGSRNDMMFALAYHSSTIDLMQNTGNFENGGSVETRVRNAYLHERFDEVLSLLDLKPPFSFWKVTQFVCLATILETKSWDKLYRCCNHDLLLPRDIYNCLAYNSDRYNQGITCEVFYKFLFQLSYKRQDFTWVNYVQWGCVDASLVNYAYACGAGWILSVNWTKNWTQWTPVLHASLTEYTFDFRYRARPLLAMRDVGALIVKWMAYAIWVDQTSHQGKVHTRKDNIEYLARFTKHLPAAGVLATKVEKLVVEMRKMVKLYLAK